jgi:hypothetical protein
MPTIRLEIASLVNDSSLRDINRHLRRTEAAAIVLRRDRDLRDAFGKRPDEVPYARALENDRGTLSVDQNSCTRICFGANLHDIPVAPRRLSSAWVYESLEFCPEHLLGRQSQCDLPQRSGRGAYTNAPH